MDNKDKKIIKKLIEERMLVEIAKHYGVFNDNGLVEYLIEDIPTSEDFIRFKIYLIDGEERVLLHATRKKIKKEYLKVLDEHCNLIQSKGDLVDYIYNPKPFVLTLNSGKRYVKKVIKTLEEYVLSKVHVKLDDLNLRAVGHPKYGEWALGAYRFSRNFETQMSNCLDLSEFPNNYMKDINTGLDDWVSFYLDGQFCEN